MTRLALRSLLSRPLRTALTIIAILLGVAMITGTYVLTDQIQNAFNDIFRTAYQKTSVVVSPKSAFGESHDASGGASSMSDSVLTRVRRVRGVAAADGTAQAFTAVFVRGKQVKSNGAPTFIQSNGDPRFETGSWIAGGAPSQTGEVAITSGFAAKHHLGIGDAIGVVTQRGLQTLRVSGVYKWPAEESMGGTIMVDAPLADVQRWFGLRGKLTAINVAADPGVTPAQLRARIRAALPATVDVKTGAQAAADQSTQTSAAINSFLRPALLAFGGVAVFVGAFIIFNAFSITVAQRRREFAMLRALGASRRQVLSAVVGEALSMGVLASALGLVAGLGVARLINALFKAVGADFPASGVTLAPRTIVIAALVGVGVTLLSALVPALRATRVPPVAALSEGAQLPPSRFSRLSTPAAVAVALLGGAALVAGIVSSAATTTRLLEMGLGAVLLFVSLAMLAKYVVRPLAMLIGRPLQALAPTSGRLARENAGRNPQRTAATAAALMIGLALVVFVAVFAQGLKTSFVDALARSNRANVVVTDDTGMMALPSKGVRIVRALPDVRTATGIAFASMKVRSDVTMVNAVEPRLFPAVWHFTWLKGGSDRILAGLDGHGAIVEEQYAKGNHLRIGSRLTAMAQSGKKVRLTVIGVIRDPMIMSGITISGDVLGRLGVPTDPQLFLATARPGVSSTALKAEVKTALAGFPTQTVRTEADYDAFMKKQVNQILIMLYALLAMSVTISIFGIVNTLVLSVYERTREIGMLRAIGTSRRQMRRIVRYESVITSVIGGVLGTAVGVLFGYVITNQFGDQGLVFSVPFGQLVVFLVLAAVVGVLAAVLPARRAANLNVLDAVHYE
jgi:putative ABC transport system permease protein